MRTDLLRRRTSWILALLTGAFAAACARDTSEPAPLPVDVGGGGGNDGSSSGGGSGNGDGNGNGNGNGDGIRPQPQPNPGKLPSLTPDRVSVRAGVGDTIELTGAAGAIDPPMLATKVALVSLRRLDGLTTAPVAPDGSFHAVLPGRTGDRLAARAATDLDAWPSGTVDVGATTLVTTTECLGVAPFPPVTGGGTVSFALFSDCSTSEQLEVVYASDALTSAPVTIGPGGSATVVVESTKPVTGLQPAVLVDASGTRRLGAFVAF